MDERAMQNSEKTITLMVNGIARSANKLNDSIHKCALLCMEHAKTYGEVNRTAAKLVDALPMSHRRALLINWFAAFSPIELKKDAKTQAMKGHLRGTAEERENLWNIEAAKATPFFAMPDVEREPDVPTFESVHNNVVSFVKRMADKADKIENADDKAKAVEEIAKLKKAVGL